MLKVGFSIISSMYREVVALAQRVQGSSVWIRANAWFVAFATHSSTRVCVNALRHAFALLVGESLKDERVAFSKRQLIVNDSYRDRLLAPEIADLVDLCNALQLSIPQRKAFFRCFLHLDSMRRAGVSRCELLRYCGLRDTPAMCHLLPSGDAFAVDASAHRSEEFRTQRWDILQLLALTFSLCTMEIQTLVRLCVEQVVEQSAPKASQSRDSEEQKTLEETEQEVENELVTAAADHERWTLQIQSCLEYSYGVSSPVEQRLGELLTRLYLLSQTPVDFAAIHGVKGIVDVIDLFPVLLFPTVWAQRVIQRRILGESTWQKLATRRVELQLAGLLPAFVSPPDIVNASNVLVYQKQKPRRRGYCFLMDLVSSSGSVAAPNGVDGQRLTPRKVLPDGDPLDTTSQPPNVSRSCFTDLQTHDDAWRRTADSVLASVFVWDEYHRHSPQTVDLEQHHSSVTTVFQHTRDQIQTRSVSQAHIQQIQRRLIRECGYQFTTFVLAKSSICDKSGNLVRSTAVKKDERRARQRYQKADNGIPLVEDKAIYWKEYKDPLEKRPFYHNVRTGESRWDQPACLLKKRRKKGKRSPTRSSPATRNPDSL